MKRLFLPILATIAFIIFVGVLTTKANKFSFNLGPTPPPESAVIIGQIKIAVEVARTASEKTKGLAGRQSLPEGSGMLFVFNDKNNIPSFWMKDMLFPIDIIWIKNGKIIKINTNLPIPEKDTPDSRLVRYSPEEPVDFVLEVNAGFSEKNAFQVGDSVDLSRI